MRTAMDMRKCAHAYALACMCIMRDLISRFFSPREHLDLLAASCLQISPVNNENKELSSAPVVLYLIATSGVCACPPSSRCTVDRSPFWVMGLPFKKPGRSHTQRQRSRPKSPGTLVSDHGLTQPRLFQFFQPRVCSSVMASPSFSRTARRDCCTPHNLSIAAMASGGKRLSSGATLAAITSCT